MKTQGSKRGRPRGASQFADEDQAPLERMYVLCQQGKSVGAAAKAVVNEMNLGPVPHQVIDRLRKKFPKFRKDKEASRPTRPEPQSGNTPLAQMVKQAQQVAKFLGPSGVKDIKEKARLMHENKDSIVKAAEHARRIGKLKI